MSNTARSEPPLKTSRAAQAVCEVACWLQRCYPLLPGRWRLTRYVQRRQALLATLPPRVRNMAPGYRLYTDPNDYDGFNYLLHGINPAEPVTRLLMSLLQPGDGMVDVGANVGFMSLLASRLVGPAGTVFAFEASPTTYARLTALRSLHDNLTRLNCAVADRDGELEFSLGPADHSGIASLRKLESAAGRVRVKAIALDSMLERLPRTSLVKIDVEGAEFLVLKGMRGLLERDRPVVVLELTPAFLSSFGHRPEDVAAFMSERSTSLVGSRTAAPSRASLMANSSAMSRTFRKSEAATCWAGRSKRQQRRRQMPDAPHRAETGPGISRARCLVSSQPALCRDGLRSEPQHQALPHPPGDVPRQ